MAEEKQGGKMSRPKGTGCIYQRAGTSVLWIKYSRNGKSFCESSHTTDKNKAGKILRNRLGEISTGTFLGPQVERVMIDELASDFLSEYRANGRKFIGNAEARWLLHLKPFFWRLPRSANNYTAANSLCRISPAARREECDV